MNKFCFVIDTNVLILTVSRRTRYQYILDKLIDGTFQIAVSTEIMLEYEEKLRQFYDEQTAESIISVLNILPNVRYIESSYHLLLIENDFDDDKFVDCAFTSNANGIVTNDRHFNVLKKTPFPKINLFKIDEFMQLLVQL
jgi:uncharacterized protein